MRQFSDGWNNPHCSLLAFCGGVIALRFFAQLPPLPPLITALALLILCAIRWRWLRPPAAALLGVCWAALTATLVSATGLPAAAEKQDVVVTGRVVGVPVVRGDLQRFDFQVERFEWRGRIHPPPGKIRLKLYQAQPPVKSGERWRFTVRLKRARGYHNPGAQFNYETHLFHHRLRATGYVRTRTSTAPPLLLAAQNPHSIAAFRERVATFIRAELPPDSRAGLVTALVVGIRSDMRADDWETLVRTGTIHLVAISGLHIGLVSGLALLLGTFGWRFAGRLPLWLPAPKAGVVAGLLTGIVYALLAGMTIPTQRAVCMLAVVAAALFFGRRPFGWETLTLALAAVLAVDPLAPLSGGLWLSFGAVVILIIGARRSLWNESRAGANASARHRKPPKPPSPLNPLRRALAKLGAWWWVQLMLLVGMAPLLLALFHQFSLSAPLANLAAIPVIGLLAVPLGLLGLLLYALGLETPAALAFHAALWLIEQLWQLLNWLSAVNWSVWRQPSPPPWSLPFAAVGVLLLLSPRVAPARWSGLLWLLPLFSGAPPALAPGEFRYTLLEVGHGLASVVETRGRLLLYDAGPRYAGGFDSGKSVVVPFLQQLGAGGLDAVIVSHGDNDHIGGHRAVLDRFAAARVLTSAPGAIAGAQRCVAGQRWVWDEVRFEILSPPADARAHGNEASCVLKVTSAFGSLLLTGDIGKPAETRLLASGADLAADILQTPHHGSKTSSTAAFLERVRPAAALNSIGYLNRYHHPDPGVAARYAARQIPLYNTADEGAITATFTAAGITLQGSRATAGKYWLLPAKQLAKPVTFSLR